jgi:hypothetical protein
MVHTKKTSRTFLRDRLILLPPPKQICFYTGSNSGSRPHAVLADIGRPEPDAFRLIISCDAIRIEAARASGHFYGRQTLAQIRHQFPSALPCLDILDWPDYFARGFYHDVTRGKVPKLKTLLALADKCAHYKINQLQLYVEHTYAFKRHPEVWRGADPLTADEIRKLDAHCAKRHIDLVPSFSTFGHFYTWIRTEKFQHLNELERDVSGDPFNWHDRMAHYTLNCQNPESIALVREIIQEVRPLFRSGYFNLCADETFDLGRGKNKALAEKLGTGRLYLGFLKKIIQAVREAGAIPMFWGDVIGHYPELIGEIPQDAIVLDWDYSARLESNKAELMQKSGRAFYICPGVSGWNKWLNDYGTAHRNITRFARLGKKHGASGLLNADWGDFGHINALGLSFPGLILGGSAAWNSGSSALREPRFEEAVSRYEFGDPSGRLLGLMREAAAASRTNWWLIALRQQPRPVHPPETPAGTPSREVLKHAKALDKIFRLTTKIQKILSKATPLDPLVCEEIRTGLLGLRVMEEASLFLNARHRRNRTKKSPKAKAVAGRLLSLDARLHRDWLQRNKPSEYARIREVLLGIANDILRHDLENSNGSMRSAGNPRKLARSKISVQNPAERSTV